MMRTATRPRSSMIQVVGMAWDGSDEEKPSRLRPEKSAMLR